jgi:Fe-S-cluster containining protein
MRTSFKCKNCGKCCSAFYAQINLTIGDLIRISNFLEKPISYILKNFISINPFGDPANPTKFSYEFGINMPCLFRKNERCAIYKTRPLNCRLFPYWILVQKFVFNQNKIIDKSYKCMNNLELKKDKIKKYSDYSKIVGDILIQEASLTDNILYKLNIEHSIDLSKNKDYQKLVTKYKDKRTNDNLKQLETEKIRLAKRIFGKLKDSDIKVIEDEAKRPFLLKIVENNTKRLEEAEDILS